MKVVLSTFADPTEAKKVAALLVDENLAACIQVGLQIQSFYQWKGETCREQECSFVMKVSDAKLPALKERFHELHSYEVPQWIVLSAEASDAYGAWVQGG